jgi:ubiquinone/menaquinone biosynthesis C-methylase UbiE
MTELPTHFNRVLRRFADDLLRPEYAAKVNALRELVGRVHAQGLDLRLDNERDWENAHVLLELERLAADRGPLKLLDAGGGNGPTAYLLAEAGHDVTVMDVDRGAISGLEHNAPALGLGERLRAVHGGMGPWPFDDAQFDVVVSISVIEGVLRSQRAGFFDEAARVLRPAGSLLLTFDYGAGARYVSDAPASPAEVERDFVEATPFERVGPAFECAPWHPEVGPPVKAIVPGPDGLDTRVAEYSFGALHLRRG